MKAYRFEVLVIDHEGYHLDNYKAQIENATEGRVFEQRCYEIGDWTDEHPLNKFDTDVATYLELSEELK